MIRGITNKSLQQSPCISFEIDGHISLNKLRMVDSVALLNFIIGTHLKSMTARQ
jgi:hypothetical protein